LLVKQAAQSVAQLLELVKQQAVLQQVLLNVSVVLLEQPVMLQQALLTVSVVRSALLLNVRETLQQVLLNVSVVLLEQPVMLQQALLSQQPVLSKTYIKPVNRKLHIMMH
jgi:hypothetical protein